MANDSFLNNEMAHIFSCVRLDIFYPVIHWIVIVNGLAQTRSATSFSRFIQSELYFICSSRNTLFLYDSLLFLTGGILNVFLKLYITGVTDYVVDFLKFRSL